MVKKKKPDDKQKTYCFLFVKKLLHILVYTERKGNTEDPNDRTNFSDEVKFCKIKYLNRVVKFPYKKTPRMS